MSKWKSRDALIEYMSYKFQKPAVAIAGVGIGDFAAKVLDEIKPELLQLVDNWKGAAWQAVAVAERFKKQIKKKINKHGTHAVEVSKKTSVQGSKVMIADTFDWVWLSSCTEAELKAWSLRVKNGGWILGEGYGAAADVIRAFRLANPEFKLAGTTDDGCWGMVRIVEE